MNRNRMSFIETSKNEIYLELITKELYNKGNKYLFNDWKISVLQKKVLFAVAIKSIFPILYIIYILYNGVVSFMKIVGSKSVNISQGTYFLATDNFSPTLNDKIIRNTQDAVWILNANVQADNYRITSNKYYSVYELTSIKDLIKVCTNSFFVLFDVYRKLGSYYILFTLNSFKWLLYKSAVDKIPYDSTIYFLDHKDRWALLEDKLKVKNKILIQHGIEITSNYHKSFLSVNGSGYCFNMPYKFSTVTKVLAFSETDFKSLCLSILSNVPAKEIIGFGFALDEISHERFSVLIIGEVALYSFKEKEIIERLQNSQIDIYLKNHPKNDSSFYKRLQQSLSFNLIEGRFFPNVDLVISYESTLASEYSSAGIEVVYHTRESIEDIVEKINLIRRSASKLNQ